MSLPVRNRTKLNYALLNRKGLSAVKLAKGRKNKQNKVRSAPSTPLENLNKKKTSKETRGKGTNMNKVVEKLKQIEPQEIVMTNGSNAFITSDSNVLRERNVTLHSKNTGNNNNNRHATINTHTERDNRPIVVIPSTSHDCDRAGHILIDESNYVIDTNNDNGNNTQSIRTSKNQGTKNSGKKPAILNSIEQVNSVITDLDNCTDMSSLEERKKKAMEEIASMQAQLDALDEDEELKQLLAKQQELRDKLEKRKASQSTPVATTRSKKSSKTKNRKSKSTSINHRDENIPEESTNEIEQWLKNAQQQISLKENIGRNKSTMKANDVDEAINQVTGDDIQNCLPSIAQIQDALHVTDKRNRNRKTKRSKKPRRKPSSSDSLDSEYSTDSSSSDSESSDEDDRSYKRKKSKCKSGLFAKAANAKIVSNEIYAHAALDAQLGNKSTENLSFNLLVAGELEIILDPDINKREKETRIEVLKSLAYKHEYLNRKEILQQYSGFIGKIERGKFKWGSKRALRLFEQQLLFSISIESRRNDKYVSEKSARQKSRFEERTKYCMDYNRGFCKFDKQHEGKINGQVITKHHICKRCLVEDHVELSHPEKECSKAK